MRRNLATLLFVASILIGQEVKTGLTFLQLGVGGRGTGIGGIGAGIVSPEALYYNPAGLANLNLPFALFTHSEWLANTRYDYISYGSPLGPGFLSLGLKSLWALDLEKRIFDTPQFISKFGVYDFCGTVGYAYPIIEQLALGANFNIINQIHESYVGYTLSGGIGIIYRTFIPGLDIGLAVNNLGPVIKLNTQFVPLPAQIRLGFSYLASEYMPCLFVDLTKSLNGGFGIGAGIEYKIGLVAFRLGYNSLEGTAFGLGLGLKRVNVDYSFQPFVGLGSTHRISVTYTWGEITPAKPEDPNLALRRQTSESFYNDGLAAMALGDFNEAKNNFDRALSWDPSNTKALEKYQEAEKRGKEKAIIEHFQQAEMFFNNKNYLEALSELEYVIYLDSTHTNAKLLLAQTQTLLGRPVKGETDFDAGLSFYVEGKYRAAINSWEKVLKENPDRSDIASFIESAKTKIRQKVDSLIEESSKFERQAQHRQALDRLNRALTLDPQNPLVLAKLSEIRSSMLKDVSTHLYKGIEYFDKRDYQVAENEFQIVLSLDPNNRDARDYLKRIKNLKTTTRRDLFQKNIMAITAYGIDDLETAIRLWEEILSENPNFPDVKKNLERARAKLKEMKR